MFHYSKLKFITPYIKKRDKKLNELWGGCYRRSLSFSNLLLNEQEYSPNYYFIYKWRRRREKEEGARNISHQTIFFSTERHNICHEH